MSFLFGFALFVYLFWVIYSDCIRRFDVDALIFEYQVPENKASDVKQHIGSSKASRYTFRQSMRFALDAKNDAYTHQNVG